MLPGVESGGIGAVHRTRVASRRLRELLPVLQLDHTVVRKLGRRLRNLARRLGRVRDLDVLLLLIDDLRESRRLPERALRRVADIVRPARDEARGRLSSKAAATEFRRVARRLEAVAADLENAAAKRSRGRGWRWAIDARVAHRASLLKTAIRNAGAMYLPDRIHLVRLALKKLRYGIELSLEAEGIKENADLRALKRGQALLGRLRDRQLLLERVRRVQASLTPPDIAAWRELDAFVTSLEHNCRRLHARYVRNRAAMTGLCDRLGARPSSPARASSSGRSAVRRAG